MKTRSASHHARIEILKARIAPARYVWQVGTGNCNVPGNWFNETTGATATDFPDDASDEAIFDGSDFQPKIVSLNISVTINKLGSQAGAVTQITPASTQTLSFVSGTVGSGDGTPIINVVSGSMTVATNLNIADADGLEAFVNPGASLTLSGRIVNFANDFDLIKTGNGPLTLSGGGNNDFTGVTRVQAGTLLLAKSSGVAALAGDATVADGAKLETAAANVINDTAKVLLAGSGTLKLGANETVNTLGFDADVTQGLLDLGGNTLTQTAGGNFKGGFLSDGTLNGGILELSGSDADAHSLTVASGITIITGSFPAIDFTTGANLVHANNTIGTLIANGPFNVGGSIARQTGVLSVENISVLANGLNATFDITGTTPGTNHDQIVVRPGGTIALGNGLGGLTPFTLGLVPDVGQSFTLIDNQGSQPVSGFFAGAPEGKVFTFGGIDYTLTYTGGDGNDVVLSSPPRATATS